MSAPTENVFNLNGNNYDSSKLPPEGQRILSLLSEAQNELTRLESRKAPTSGCPETTDRTTQTTAATTGYQPTGWKRTSAGPRLQEIPTTPVKKPEQEPAPFPDTIPNEIRAQPWGRPRSLNSGIAVASLRPGHCCATSSIRFHAVPATCGLVEPAAAD